MADTTVKTEVVEKTKSNGTINPNSFSILATPEGFQKYILGTKKNGNPRAVYDVVTGVVKIMDPKKKKKGKKKKGKNKKKYDNASIYDLYKTTKGKKKKKKKKNKYWHI